MKEERGRKREEDRRRRRRDLQETGADLVCVWTFVDVFVFGLH